MLFPRRDLARRLLALPLLCWALSGQAQPRLSAEDAVALALSQPHVRDDLEAEVDLARSQVQAARVWPNPILEASHERVGEGPLGPSRETTVVLSQQFDLSGRRGLSRRAAEQGVAAAEATIGYQRIRLRGEVLRAYYTAASAEQRRQVQSGLAQGLRELARVAGHRQLAGDLSGYERRRIAQADAQTQARLAEAEGAAQASRAQLAGWIGETALTSELDARLPALPDGTLADDARSTELDMLEARRAQAEAQAKAAGRPSLPVSLGVGRKRIIQGSFSDDALVMEVGLPLPLFDRNQAERTRTAAEAQRADAQYQRALIQTRSRRAAAFARAQRLSESARHLQDIVVPEAARLTVIAQASFAEGELDLVGLLDAFDAQAAALDQALQQQLLALDAILELELLSPPALRSPTDASQ